MHQRNRVDNLLEGYPTPDGIAQNEYERAFLRALKPERTYYDPSHALISSEVTFEEFKTMIKITR